MSVLTRRLMMSQTIVAPTGVLVFDDFVGASGTDIAAHAPDTDVVGGGWAQSVANGIELDGAGGAKWAAPHNEACIAVGQPDHAVTMHFTPGGADNRCSVMARFDGNFSSRTCYEVNFRSGDSGGTINLNRIMSDSTTVLASAAYSVNLSSTYKISIAVTGASQVVSIDDAPVLYASDTYIVTGPYAGFGGYLRKTENGRFFDFTAEAA